MSIATILKKQTKHSHLSDNVMIVVLSYCDIISLPIGLWSSPSVKGSRPPPCSKFSLTMTDEEHAVMFGGVSPGSGYSADVYVIHLPTMVSDLLLNITLIVCLSVIFKKMLDISNTAHR